MNTTFDIKSYLKIDFCILSPKLSSLSNQFYFTITKNRTTFEFSSNNESIIDEWLLEMKLICIHYHFHQEYRALKLIGKGSFARVIYLYSILSDLES